MDEGLMEEMIMQAINGAIATIPSYMEDVKENSKALNVDDPKEFVYGMVMGIALGASGAILSTQAEMPTAEDQMKVRDLVYKHVPEIRDLIFS